jgi:hypothetical protein
MTNGAGGLLGGVPGGFQVTGDVALCSGEVPGTEFFNGKSSDDKTGVIITLYFQTSVMTEQGGGRGVSMFKLCMSVISLFIGS